MNKLSILIVNWNGSRFLDDCLHSIREKVSVPYEVIVVDNNSTDGSQDAIAELYPWVKLIRSDDNLGFGRGNNLAAQHATGDVFLLLNLDTVLLLDPTPIASALIDDPAIGCIGAKMCNESGEEVVNCGHFPTPLRLLLFTSMFWKPYQEPYGPPGLHAQCVDWVEGSWMLIRREAWDKVGGFDERIFLYGEDVDLCKDLTDLGLKVLHASTLAYRHYTGWSVHRLPYQFASFRFYHQKHSAHLQRTLAEAVLYLGLKVRLLCFGFLSLLTRQERYSEKITALRNVDRSWGRFDEPDFGVSSR